MTPGARPAPPVSVVICTYNRAEGLRETLDSLTLQRYREFEVVVVNGPSTDNTASVLADYPRPIRVVDNPLANLSASRNIGIRAAAGDIVGFIDDDALPEPTWLEQAVPAFDDPEVAGVGGLVLDHTGMAPQYTFSAATRFGEPRAARAVPFDSHCIPGADVYPYLQGTNALFRREILAQVGLFDEMFDFYLDETDLCCRLVDAGWMLRQLNTAVVHHKFLPSKRRNAAKVTTNFFSIMRNFVYFGYRHARLTASEFDVMMHTRGFLDSVIHDARMHESLGNVEPGHVARCRTDCERAIEEGIRIGRAADQRPLPPVTLDRPDFMPFLADLRGQESRRIVIISSRDEAGPSGRAIAAVARELVSLGHEVRVFVTAEDVATVDLERLVWVHRLLPVPTPGRVPQAAPAIDAFASVCGNELERIAPWWEPDVVVGWFADLDVLGVARTWPGLPVVALLDAEGPERDAPSLLIRELAARSSHVLSTSEEIVAVLDERCPGALHRSRVTLGGRSVDAATLHRVIEAIPPRGAGLAVGAGSSV